MNTFLSFFSKTFNKKISRKSFLKVAGAFIVGVVASSWFGRRLFGAKPIITTGRVYKGIQGDYDLSVITSEDPYGATIKAVNTLGGMQRFVRAGDTVVIKPNIAWDRTPEYATNTNPEVVAALIDMCNTAGAKRVNVFDITCNDSKRAYDSSGIAAIAKKRGANVFIPDDWNMMDAHFDFESPMEKWPILREAIECDAFINVPVLKHHSLAGLTISMKNLMGVCGGKRGKIHFDLGRKLVDLTKLISPELTVVDASKVLVRNGPTGGNLEDVKNLNTIIAGTDPTLADSFAATLMGQEPLSIPNIKSAVDSHFGNHILENANIVKIAM